MAFSIAHRLTRVNGVSYFHHAPSHYCPSFLSLKKQPWNALSTYRLISDYSPINLAKDSLT